MCSFCSPACQNIRQDPCSLSTLPERQRNKYAQTLQMTHSPDITVSEIQEYRITHKPVLRLNNFLWAMGYGLWYPPQWGKTGWWSCTSFPLIYRTFTWHVFNKKNPKTSWVLNHFSSYMVGLGCFPVSDDVCYVWAGIWCTSTKKPLALNKSYIAYWHSHCNCITIIAHKITILISCTDMIEHVAHTSSQKCPK